MLPSHSTAALFHGPGKRLTIESIPLPSLAPGEALVRVSCATICGSDLHSISGRRHSPAPAILGHEMVGLIAATGPGGLHSFSGEPLAVGRRVTWSMVWSCGQCYFCRLGLNPKCEHLFKFGHSPLGPASSLSGAYSQFCLLPAGSAIFPVPDNIPDIVAAPANCATATIAAVLRHAHPIAGSSVLVLGAGMLGLTACAMASASGAHTVIAVDPDPRRARLASRFGATHSLPPGPALLDSVLSLTSSRGVDCAFELSGSPASAEAALPLLRPGGHLLLAGAVFPSRPLALPAEDIVRRLIRISGVYNYTPVDLATALSFLSAHLSRFPFPLLVPAAFPLSEINGAIDFAQRERPPRAALLPG